MHRQDRERQQAQQLAVGLGWFSIALGLAEVAAPGSLARFIGLPDDERTTSVLRAFGAREIGNGVAILAQPDRPGWLWSRVGGDLLDLASLGRAMTFDGVEQSRLSAAAAAVLGVTALDALCAERLSRPNGHTTRRASSSVHVARSVTINRPLEQLYAFWRRFENLPRFMRHLESVRVVSDRRSVWRAKGPAGMTFEWEADIVQDRENDSIVWRSLPGSDVQHGGTVRFARAPGNRGTEVRVSMDYRPPAGAVGRGIAWLFGREPEQQVAEDLQRFKQLMEVGEIPLSDGPGLWRPAQPATDPNDVRALAEVQR